MFPWVALPSWTNCTHVRSQFPVLVVVTVQLMGQQYYVKEKASPKVTLAWLSFTLSLWCNVNSIP